MTLYQSQVPLATVLLVVESKCVSVGSVSVGVVKSMQCVCVSTGGVCVSTGVVKSMYSTMLEAVQSTFSAVLRVLLFCSVVVIVLLFCSVLCSVFFCSVLCSVVFCSVVSCVVLVVS